VRGRRLAGDVLLRGPGALAHPRHRLRVGAHALAGSPQGGPRCPGPQRGAIMKKPAAAEQLSLTEAKPHRFSPEELAKRAAARKPTTPSGSRVKVALTLFLRRELAEALTARAIREGTNVAALVAQILEAELRRK